MIETEALATILWKARKTGCNQVLERNKNIDYIRQEDNPGIAATYNNIGTNKNILYQPQLIQHP